MRDRLFLSLLTAWVVLSTGMWVAASSTFAVVNRLLEGGRPELAEHVKPRELGELRPELRLVASETNRRLFSVWSWTESALAVLVPLLGLRGFLSTRRRWASLIAASVTALILAQILNPAIRTLGPTLDFVPRPFPPAWAETGRGFFRLHALYMGLDLVKSLLLLGVLILAVARPRGAIAGHEARELAEGRSAPDAGPGPDDLPSAGDPDQR